MRVLWVATKPPWPPRDGGRLVTAETVACLREAGHVVRVLAPGLGGAAPGGDGLTLVPARPRPWASAALRAAATGRPLSVARHELPAVRRALAQALEGEGWDVVVAEQLQALEQCAPALAAGRPVVLRAQNVESDLWLARARLAAAWLRPLLRREALRLARHEAAVLERVNAVAALTPEDTARLQALAPGARVRCLAAPFPDQLPPAEAPLEGAPAVVVLAGGWRPNLDGARWFLQQAWPLVRAEHPGARLHLFGARLAGPGVTSHPAPPDSRAAFAPGSLHVVPLRVAAGVRVKILEAWARGVAVVATGRAASGLGAQNGRELLLADDPAALAAAIRSLVEEPGLGARLAAAGRERLAARHSPRLVARAWSDLLAEVARPR